MDGLKRGSAAIVGVAESDLGQVADGMSPMDLVAQGMQRALADCGLTLKDVDGLFCAMTQQRMSIVSLIEYLGIAAEIHRLQHDRRLVVRVSCRAGGSGDRGRPLQRRGDRLRLDPAQRRAQAGLAARDQSVRDAVQAVPADERLCARGLAPHASVRHDARAACRRSRSRRANGRSSIRSRGRRSRSPSRMC